MVIVQALTVLEFLVKRGSDQCTENSKNLMPKLEDLQVFEYTSPDGRDHGVNVRHRCRPRDIPSASWFMYACGCLLTAAMDFRAQAIVALLKDSGRLQQERAAFASKRQVYKGFSREQLSGGGLVQRTHSADSMDGFSGNNSYKRQQVCICSNHVWQSRACTHAFF